MYWLPTTNILFSRSKNLCEVQNHWRWLSSQHWIHIFFQDTLNRCSQMYNQAAEADQLGKKNLAVWAPCCCHWDICNTCTYTRISRWFTKPLHCGVQHKYICRFGRRKESRWWCWKWLIGFQASSWDADFAQQLKNRMEVIYRQWSLGLRKKM